MDVRRTREQFRYLRRQYGLSQYQVANRVGRTQQLISFYELGHCELSTPTRARVWGALNALVRQCQQDRAVDSLGRHLVKELVNAK